MGIHAIQKHEFETINPIYEFKGQLGGTVAGYAV